MLQEKHSVQISTEQSPRLDLYQNHTEDRIKKTSDGGPEHIVGHSTCRRLAPPGPSI